MTKKVSYGDKWDIESLINEENRTGIVLPYFQRPFVWDEEQQKRLIASLLAGVPIGGLLFFKGMGGGYAARPLCFSKLRYNHPPHTSLYLLDGQQRLSVLKTVFDDVFSKKNISDIKRVGEIKDWKDICEHIDENLSNRWFITLKPLESGENDDIFCRETLRFSKDVGNFSPDDYIPYITCVPIKKSGTKDDFSPARSKDEIIINAVNKECIPLWLLLSEGGSKTLHTILFKIGQKLTNPEKHEEENVSIWVIGIRDFLRENITEATIPNITLEANQMDLGISIFETINSSGTALSPYDLLVARMSLADRETSLTEHIEKYLEEISIEGLYSDTYSNGKNWNLTEKERGFWDKGLPSKDFIDIFLACLGLECNVGDDISKTNVEDVKKYIKYTKTKAVLKISPEDINKNWNKVVETMVQLFQFLHFRCGIVKLSDLRYRLMASPLYLVFRMKNQVNESILKKCEYWYWSALFSGQYRERQNEQSMEDCKKLHNFCFGREVGEDGVLQGVKNPFRPYGNTIFQQNGYSDLGNLARTDSAGNFNKGLNDPILQYLLSRKLSDLENEVDRSITSWNIADELEIGGKLIKADKHHLIPCGKKRKADIPLNSPLNLTYITATKNKKIGGNTSNYYHKTGDLDKALHLLPDDFYELSENYRIANDTEKNGEPPKTDKERALEVLLEKRFRKIKANVQERLTGLISD